MAKKCKDKKRGVKSELSVEKFLSHSTEIFRRGTLLCCVSKNLWWRKSLWKKVGRGDYRNFPSKIFCLTVPKYFVEEPFCAVFQKISGGEKNYGKEEGRGNRNFLSNIFCPEVPKHFVGETFSLSLVSGLENIYAS